MKPNPNQPAPDSDTCICGHDKTECHDLDGCTLAQCPCTAYKEASIATPQEPHCPICGVTIPNGVTVESALASHAQNPESKPKSDLLNIGESNVNQLAKDLSMEGTAGESRRISPEDYAKLTQTQDPIKYPSSTLQKEAETIKSEEFRWL